MRMAIAAGFALLALMSAPAEAQRGRGRGSGGWGTATVYGRLYDVNTVQVVRGTVVRVTRFVPREGMVLGVYVLVDTGTDRIAVHVGPEWYFERQDILIEVGDAIEVTGSRIVFDGRPAIIAAEIHKGTVVLRLRDRDGFPVWNGWHRR